MKIKSITLKENFDDIIFENLNDYKLVFNEYFSKARDLVRSMNVTIENINRRRDHEKVEIKKMLKDLVRIYSKMTTTSIQVKKLKEENVKLRQKMSSFDNIYFGIYKILIKETNETNTRNDYASYNHNLLALR